MSSSHEDSITIKLEIQIPTTGGTPTVLFSPHVERKSGGVSFFTAGLEEPAGGPTMTKTTGEICVRGSRNNDGATNAWAKVFQGSPTVPANPPSDATPCPLNTTSGVFSAPLVPGVTGHPAVNPHTVATWELVGSVYTINDAKPITPIWGQYTECDYPFMVSAGKARPCSSPLTFELLPVRWSVDVKGFAGGELARANGCWVMRLMTAPKQKILYCNGGDGLSVPRVQLVCESPFAEAWQLRFEVGNSRVTYFLPATKFNQQGKNTFGQAVSEILVDDCSIPALVMIHPE